MVIDGALRDNEPNSHMEHILWIEKALISTFSNVVVEVMTFLFSEPMPHSFDRDVVGAGECNRCWNGIERYIWRVGSSDMMMSDL